MGFTKSNASSIKLDSKISLLQQIYEKVILPDRVVVLKLVVFPDDQGGWFKENLRIDVDGNILALKDQKINFKICQSNTSLIAPHGKRFWHIHPAKKTHEGQNEIWTTNGTLLLGLIDLRKGSSTYGIKSKLILSPDRAVYIPAGIAHGFINPNDSCVTLVYFTDQYFVPSDETQEHRIDPKEIPFDFVEPELM